MSGSWQRNVSVLFCFCILANCGSSSGGTPDNTYPKYPVVFEPVFAPAGRFEGSFNLLAASGTDQGIDGTKDSTGVESYGLTLGGFEENDIPTTVTLTLPDGQTVEMTSPYAGFFQGTIDEETVFLTLLGVGNNILNVALGRGYASDYSISAFGTIGYETPEIGMPLSGSASYAGRSYMYASGIVSPEFTGNGVMELGVDFASGTVSGDVFRGDDAVISLTDGQVVDNGFVGQLSVTSSPFMNTIDGTTQGIFYGDQPTELAGVFEGSFSGPDGTGTVAGTFSGDNAPLQ